MKNFFQALGLWLLLLFIAACCLLFIESTWGTILGMFVALTGTTMIWWPKKKIIDRRIRVGPYSWTWNDFCRGWLITGQTGSGKTACAVRTILHSLYRDCPGWGGAVVDQKGQFYEILEGTARHYGKADNLVVLRIGGDSANRYNLLSYPGIPWRSYAGLIVDTAECIGVKLEPFWKSNAEDLIASILELTATYKTPTLADVYDAISSIPTLQALCQRYNADKLPPPARDALAKLQAFVALTQATRDGVLASTKTFLSFCGVPAIRRVLCPEVNTVNFQDIDRGKVFVLSMPQAYARERIFFNTFLKLLFSYHARFRFDRPGLSRSNLLVFVADEAQLVVTSSVYSSDHETVSIIREAKATFVLATQSTTSFNARLKKEDVAALCLNLSNQVYFTLADADAADLASKALGTHKEWKRNFSSGTSGNSTTSRELVDRPNYPADTLRSLAKYECVLKHCSGKSMRLFLPPRDDRGHIPPFYFHERFWIFGSVIRMLCRILGE